MRTKFKIGALALVLILFATACEKGPLKGFTELESGLFYQFHVQNDEALTPVVGDYMILQMVVRTKDSTLNDSREFEKDYEAYYGFPYGMPLQESAFNGDLHEGLALMAIGDSATFAINIDTLAKYSPNAPQVDRDTNETAYLFFDIKLLDIMLKADFEAEINRKQQEYEQQVAFMQKAEDSVRNEYLKTNNISVEPTQSGLIYISEKKGSGAKAESGKSVRVHYTGKLLDGTVFDSSVERGDPIQFMLGVGQVIPGWDEGISLMNEGGKAKLIIPSHIAYGAQGSPPVIPPFSTLVFEVELIEVK